MNIDITEADFTAMENCAAIGIIGKRRTRKTTWARVIVNELKERCNRFIAMCGNKDCTFEWKEVIPDLFVVEKSTSYLQDLINYQNEKAEEFGADGIPQRYHVVLIIDDCGFDQKFMYHKTIKDLMSNGRHYGIYCVFLLQYLNQFHPQNRAQLDYVGLLHTNNVNHLKKVHIEYSPNCELKLFRAILSTATRDKGLCWIDNTKHVEVGDQVDVSNIHYKLPIFPPPSDPLCSSAVIAFSDTKSNMHIMGSSLREPQSDCIRLI